MKTIQTYILCACFVSAFAFTKAQAQEGGRSPSYISTAAYMKKAPSLQSQLENGTFIEANLRPNKEVNPRRGVPSRQSYSESALPIDGDPLARIQPELSTTEGPPQQPFRTFDVLENGTASPTDPTGAVGPNHYVNAYNSGFRVYDRFGNPLTPHASLNTIWSGENLGDPIVLYDRYADRWLMTQFSNSPNGILLAYSDGPDPVTAGWNTYRFNMSSFPDYPKYSIWSDGIYMTANKDVTSATTDEVVFVFERDDMINGAASTNVQSIGFSLPGISTDIFYSPLPFHADGAAGLPPVGTNNFIAYMQDDVWAGVATDHIKLWEIDVDWATPGNSTISTPAEIGVTAFDGLFDGGGFNNLPQSSGPDVDALQAIMMYSMPYYRFSTHNSVLMNWAVDVDGSDDLAGIRWMELRQSSDGQPWTIYQEGTYSQTDGLSRFCGSMAMDEFGNIGLGFTVVNTTKDISLRFTGRLAGDQLGEMSVPEVEFATGTAPNLSTRYGDYAHMTLDPTNDLDFWHVGEYFKTSGRFNAVGIFRLEDCVNKLQLPDPLTVIGVDERQASEVIIAANQLVSGDEALYHAGDEVLLIEDFHADNGSYLRAYIEGCTGNFEYKARAGGSEEIFDPKAEAERMDGFRIFPNPANQQFTVELDEAATGRLEILNLYGQVIHSEQVLEGQNSYQIDASDYPAGLYLIQVLRDQSNEVQVKKMIIR